MKYLVIPSVDIPAGQNANYKNGDGDQFLMLTYTDDALGTSFVTDISDYIPLPAWFESIRPTTHFHNPVSSVKDGFMASEDKTKLDTLHVSPAEAPIDGFTYGRKDGDWVAVATTADLSDGNATLVAHLANTSNPHSTTKAQVGLGNVDNTSDVNKPASADVLNRLALKAPLNSPAFTGVVSGITASMVGLNNVNNTSDANKPISTATQAALNLKAPLNSPAFTGNVTGITAAMVGLGNVTSELATKLSDAPSDGLTYARKDGTWLSIDGGGGGGGTTYNPNAVPQWEVADRLFNWDRFYSDAYGAFNNVAWSPMLGLFVASVPSSSTIYYSTDARNWQTSTLPNARNISQIIWVPELQLFAASCLAADVALTSVDGMTWIEQELSNVRDWSSITYSREHDRLVMVAKGSSFIEKSSDGVSWVESDVMPDASDWNCIIWAPEANRFCAISTAGSTVCATSPDAITWTAQSFGEDVIGSYTSVAWSPSLQMFCAVGHNSVPISSPDATTGTWTVNSTGSSVDWSHIVWIPELGAFLAYAQADISGTIITISFNGTTWTEATLPYGSDYHTGTWAKEYGMFVFLNASSGIVITSKAPRMLNSSCAFVPRVEAGTNVAMLIGRQHYWTRNGATVNVQGALQILPTSGGDATTVKAYLPFNTALTSGYFDSELLSTIIGSGSTDDWYATLTPGADTNGTYVTVSFTPPTADSKMLTYNYSYNVKL